MIELDFTQERTLIENRKISQGDLHRYAWASGDYNPIHFNARVAEQMGLPGVIAHGMLTLAFMNQAMEFVVDQFAAQKHEKFKLGAIDTRFVGMLMVDDTVSVSAKILRSTEANLQLQVWAFKNSQRDQLVCSAQATLDRL